MSDANHSTSLSPATIAEILRRLTAAERDAIEVLRRSTGLPVLTFWNQWLGADGGGWGAPADVTIPTSQRYLWYQLVEPAGETPKEAATPGPGGLAWRAARLHLLDIRTEAEAALLAAASVVSSVVPEVSGKVSSVEPERLSEATDPQIDAMLRELLDRKPEGTRFLSRDTDVLPNWKAALAARGLRSSWKQVNGRFQSEANQALRRRRGPPGNLGRVIRIIRENSN